MFKQTHLKSFLLLLSVLSLVACSPADTVKNEEYQFANGIKLLDVPPDLTSSDKNLVMQIPKPSLRACELLMAADAKFKVEQAKQPAAPVEQTETEKADDLYAE